MNEKLIVDNLNLIYFVLKSLNLYHKSDEYYDVGLIGLVKGVNSYDPDSGIAISTYLVKCIKNEILFEIRKEKAFKRKSNIDPLELYREYEDNLTYITLFDSGINIENDYLDKVEIETLRKELNNLTNNERLVLCYNFGLYGCEKHTQSEIADMLGLSPAQVSRIKSIAIEKLKNKLL